MRFAPRTSTESGFTLAELLVGMTITLMVTGAALFVFTHALKATETTRLKLTMHDHVRVALDLMVRDFLQVGQGLPSGKVVLVPSGAGAAAISRPGPANAVLTFPGGITEINAVTPGPNLGPAIGGGPATDIVTVLYADSQFERPDGTAPNAVVAADGASMVVEAAMPVAGVQDPIRVGDLIMFTFGSMSAMQIVTRLNEPADQTVFFEAGDPMNLNQRGAAQGTILQLAPVAGQPFTVAWTRLRMITYYVDEVVPERPRLMRRLNMTPARAVAFGVETLQFSFDLVDGAGNPTNVRNPMSANQIRKANLALGARSRERSTVTRDFFRTNVATQVSFRNLALVDRYQ
jgi:type II secretory pathway pseudopilin PulG